MGGVLAVVPARGGSKSIPDKNIAPVGGKPLLAWSIEAGLGARRIDRVIVTTDDESIAAEARRFGADVPFVRPAELAADTTPMAPVVAHAVASLADQGWTTRTVVLLQPTSPLRTSAHVDAAMDRFEATAADTVVTVVAVPHRFSPYSVMREQQDGTLTDFTSGEVPFDRFRRQEHPVLWARNGPAVLVTTAAVARKGSSLLGERVVGLPMAWHESIDIDEPHDLELADWLLRRRIDAASQR
jgi:CMP-N,N'-diacetyllegionaminic acid synthase